MTRGARFYMAAQVETGHLCPITMTRAAVAALAVEPALVAKLMPKIMSRRYDPRFRPWWEKTGITLGMGMTERQGGTDVRTNTTRAEPAGEGYAVNGQKWFMSAPMCDAFLVLAQAPGGLTCFLMPRFRPDGSVNGLHFQRLKDKLGNRSNASSEVEFADAFAWRVGEEGRGVRTIINMVQLTRLDCAIASAGIMRMALAQAIHHARSSHRVSEAPVDQPMMRAVLADMALEVEAATALVMRLARSFDLAASDPHEAARARLLTPAVKYWVCKTAPGFIYEAMECLGGNGYVEESILPRLYREAPVNAIWEGSGNVMCLDVLRALAHEGEAGARRAARARRRGRRVAGRARGRGLHSARVVGAGRRGAGARRGRPPCAARGGGGVAPNVGAGGGRVVRPHAAAGRSRRALRNKRPWSRRGATAARAGIAVRVSAARSRADVAPHVFVTSGFRSAIRRWNRGRRRCVGPARIDLERRPIMANILRKAVIGLGVAGTLAVAAAAPSAGPGRGRRPLLRLRRPAGLCRSVWRLCLCPGLWRLPQLGLSGRLRHRRHAVFLPRSRVAAGTARRRSREPVLAVAARAEPLLA